jgi:hypothetical protein
MSSDHILDLHDNPLYNCLAKKGLGKTQPDFAVIANLLPTPLKGADGEGNCKSNGIMVPKGVEPQWPLRLRDFETLPTGQE